MFCQAHRYRLERTDGSTTDFSFHSCIRGRARSLDQDFKEACREAVAGDLIAAEYAHFDQHGDAGGRVPCDLTGEPLHPSAHMLPVAENVPGQVFEPARPNELWTGDITSIPTDEGWLYLAGLKDVFTCEIVGYAMGERMSTDLVSRALSRAVQHKRPLPGLIHHTDRDSQYCAKAYRSLQEQFAMATSMSRKGNCFDNAPIESFWGALKSELVHHRRFASRAEARAAIREYIEIFYNRQRRRSRLGYLAPAEFTRLYWESARAA